VSQLVVVVQVFIAQRQAEDAQMLRVKIPQGILTKEQLEGLPTFDTKALDNTASTGAETAPAGTVAPGNLQRLVPGT